MLNLPYTSVQKTLSSSITNVYDFIQRRDLRLVYLFIQSFSMFTAGTLFPSQLFILSKRNMWVMVRESYKLLCRKPASRRCIFLFSFRHFLVRVMQLPTFFYLKSNNFLFFLGHTPLRFMYRFVDSEEQCLLGPCHESFASSNGILTIELPGHWHVIGTSYIKVRNNVWSMPLFSAKILNNRTINIITFFNFDRNLLIS